MRITTWMGIVLVGCGPAQANLGGVGGDTDVTGDADTDADSDSDSDTEPPGPLTWTGARQFAFDVGCEDSVEESGEQIVDAADDPRFDDVLGLCDECDAVFRIDVSPESICDGYVPISQEVFRGIAYDGERVRIYNLFQEGNGRWSRVDLALGEADSTGGITYDYEGAYYNYGYVVDGKAIIK